MIDSDCENESFHTAPSLNGSFSSIPSLADILRSQFCDVPKNFNVVHINAQSIPAHFPDMLANFDCKNIHAILISESWLKPCLPSTSYSLPGFHLIRNDRTVGGGGGVAIYLRTYIPFRVVSMSPQPPPSDAGEHLFLEVELNHTKVLLGVYYSPSLRINFFPSFEHILDTFIPSYSHTIIMGDFNTCLLKNDTRATILNRTVESFDLTILPLNATHYFPNAVPSLLDLIFVSSNNRVCKHGQCSADVFSYHDLIYLSYKIRPPKAKPRIIVQRNFGRMDLTKLAYDANNIDWSPIYDSDCVDTKVNLFTSNLLRLYDVHAPFRTIKIKHLPAPWLTNEIKSIMSQKATAKARYKCKPTPSNLEKYIHARNYCNKVCRKAQRQYIHNSVNNSEPAKVWQFLKTLGVGKSNYDSIPNDLNLDALNMHFSSSSGMNMTNKSDTLKYLSSIPTPKYAPFVFKQLADCDVKKSILSISSNAVGNDCVSRNMILPILDEILPVLSHILNYSITSGVFPSIWKEAQIIPLPKKSKPSSFSDYRPISILPFLSKVLERLIHTQLCTFLSNNALFNSFQSGFRTGHSTATALVDITDRIRLGMDDGNLTLLALLDFSNAFNTVDFQILLGILRSINISPTAVEWFRSYLSGRRQRIHTEGSYSSWCTMSTGVPQGGVLSPLLFSIFINSISKQLLSSYHLYADDLQFFSQASINDVAEAFVSMNTDLAKICDWCKNYGLSVNPTKTQVILIGSSRMISKVDWSQLPQIHFDGNLLTVSSCVKNLGIHIDKTLSWSHQLNETSRKMFASAGALRRLRNFLPTTTKIALAQSLLLPILDYADVSYPDLTEEQLNKLERLQNFSIRFIFGLRKYDHISEFRDKLKWLPIRLRRNTHILTLLYNVLFNPNTPFYLKERFKFLHDTHSRFLRSTEDLRLQMPTHSTNFYDKSFSVQAVRLWNALPLQIRKAESVNIFKKRLKEHYLSI